MKAWTRIGLVAVAVMVGAASLPTIATAAKKRGETQLTLTDASADAIRGELSSSRVRCLADRTIRLTEPGESAPFLVLTTDAAGVFQIYPAAIPPDVNAYTVEAVRVPRGPQRVCGSDYSHVNTDDGSLTGGPFFDSFRGTLSSNIEACITGRTIEVYEVSSDPTFVGWNITDAEGDWILTASGGRYEARAVPEIAGGPDAYIFCGARVSPTWDFEERPDD